MKKRPYRTKEEMARDVAIVLGMHTLHLETKWAVLHDVAWRWTTYYGKYQGCPYWTPAARAQFALDGIKRLRHEHAVPKNLVIKWLFSLQLSDETIVDQKRVYEICEKFLIGVVVTLEEDQALSKMHHQKMPPEFDDPASPFHQDPWLRYRKSGIDVVDATGQSAFKL